MNIVLNERYRALTVLGRYTAAPESGRSVYRGKIDLVRINPDSHWNVSLDYSHVAPIYAPTTLAHPSTPAAATPRHTLGTGDDHLTLGGVLNRPAGAVDAELAGSIDLDAMQSRPGLLASDGDLLTQQGLASLIGGPLRRLDETVQARLNLTLNGTLGAWRWSSVGRLDQTTRVTQTDSGSANNNISPVLPSPGLLGRRCAGRADPGCVSTTTRRAGADFYANGDLFPLAAGSVTAGIRAGFAFSGLRGGAATASTDLSRDEGSAQANVEFPLVSAGSRLGRLSFGLNGEAHEYSDYGAHGTIGSTLDWAPSRAVDLLLTVSQTEQPPTLLQLGQAPLSTPYLRDYDFVAGTTTIAERREGGNDALTPERARIARARLQFNPLPRAALTVSAEYTLQRTRDPILTLSAATAAASAAFPDRFVRQNGFLTAIDLRPVNGARRDNQQVRWGLTYSTAFGSGWAAKSGASADHRDQFQIALYDTWRFQDEVVLKRGLPTLDLLGGDIIGDDGGTPNHRVELQTSVVTRPFSADVSAAWQTPTTARGPQPGQQLTFMQGVTVNLRLQINLTQQPWLRRALPFLRGSLNLSADNILGAHASVRDANGVVPAAYSGSYLNPTGRTFRITLRKRFH